MFFGNLLEIADPKVDVTQTPAFKAWFGKSKVVDDNGNPLIVYQGFSSSSGFGSEYKLGFHNKNIRDEKYKNNFGFFFTTKESVATDYGDSIRKLFLNIRKPLDFTSIDNEGFLCPADFSDFLDSKGIENDFDKEDNESDFTYMYFYNGDKKLRESIIAKGYDGVFFNESTSKGTTLHIVAFYPSQIKSVTENKATFSPARDNITETLHPKESLAASYEGWKIFMVVGKPLRKKDTKFIGGDNPAADTLDVPKKTIWIEKMLDQEDEDAFLVHELVEYYFMEFGKQKYEDAHKKANDAEGRVRNGETTEKVYTDVIQDEEFRDIAIGLSKQFALREKKLEESLSAPKSKVVKASSLYSPAWKIKEVIEEIDRGETSRNSGKILISRMGPGRYFVMDGNHRVVEGILAGKTSFDADFNQHVPDLERAAGAYNSVIESAVQIMGEVKRMTTGSATEALEMVDESFKHDRLALRYAIKAYDQISNDIMIGKIKDPDPPFKELKNGIPTGQWTYPDIKYRNLPKFSLMVSTPCEKPMFRMSRNKRYILIDVPGWETPDRNHFIHEFVHFLDAIYNSKTWKKSTDALNNDDSLKSYFGSSHEKSAYFIDMLSVRLEPAIIKIMKSKDPAATYEKYFGGDKPKKLVEKEFKKRGLWKHMDADTRNHHIQRFKELLDGMADRLKSGAGLGIRESGEFYDDTLPDSEEDMRKLVVHHHGEEQKAKAAGDKHTAFKHHMAKAHLPFDWYRRRAVEHIKKNKIAAFKFKHGNGNETVTVVHPDTKNPGKIRVTDFDKEYGGPTGHAENFSSPEEAVRDMSGIQQLVPVDYKTAMQGWKLRDTATAHKEAMKRMATGSVTEAIEIFEKRLWGSSGGNFITPKHKKAKKDYQIFKSIPTNPPQAVQVGEDQQLFQNWEIPLPTRNIKSAPKLSPAQAKIKPVANTYQQVKGMNLPLPGELLRVEKPVWVSILKLKETQKNNQTKEGQTKAWEIAKAVRKAGKMEAVLADINGNLYDGHHRLEAFRKMGLGEIPVQYLEMNKI